MLVSGEVSEERRHPRHFRIREEFAAVDESVLKLVGNHKSNAKLKALLYNTVG